MRPIQGFLPTLILSGLLTSPSQAQNTPGKHPVRIEDIERITEVGSPVVSSDGNWIAYTATTIDREDDKRKTAVWIVGWDGKQNLRLTYGTESETAPQFSPDGRYLSFLSSRPGKAKGTQLWVMDHRGGEAWQFTDVKVKISSYHWSPNGKQILLLATPDEEAEKAAANPKDAPAKDAVPKPIVTDRYHFKQDGDGYLTASSRNHLYLYDTVAKKLDTLTTNANFEEFAPAWSPDGKWLAFTSNHDADPDRTVTEDLFVMEPRSGAVPKKVATTRQPSSQTLKWSPDGRMLLFLEGPEAKWNAYGVDSLASVAVAGGPVIPLTRVLDRPASSPGLAGTMLHFLAADDRRQYVYQIPIQGGSLKRLTEPGFHISDLAAGAGRVVVRASTDTSLGELYALENGRLRRLTGHNTSLVSDWDLSPVEDLQFRSRDGTDIHGIVVKPRGYVSGRKYPTVLLIHGGPNGQDSHGLQNGHSSAALDRQLLAANGYLVLSINYRGSSGRGAAFTQSIAGDWGHKEVEDLLAGVDAVIASGLADPERLGIGGWSYGGILTDYTIATDTRFKAAISGAGSANQLSMYGSDMYIVQYDNELGPPWRSPEAWMKVSYPFFKADKIRTPTLFLGGEKDFNVPIAGGEQMYQALRSLGVPTQLVVYPGETHGIQRPSYVRDRLERYLSWYNRYLKPSP